MGRPSDLTSRCGTPNSDMPRKRGMPIHAGLLAWL
jgi:hypothetical protein